MERCSLSYLFTQVEPLSADGERKGMKRGWLYVAAVRRRHFSCIRYSGEILDADETDGRECVPGSIHGEEGVDKKVEGAGNDDDGGGGRIVFIGAVKS